MRGHVNRYIGIKTYHNFIARKIKNKSKRLKKINAGTY